MQQLLTKKEVMIYVDGFNLYHRVLEQNPDLKWLCLKTLFSKFIFPNDSIRGIKYFTAKVDTHHEKPTPKQLRQCTYWSALESTGVEIIPGRLEQRKRECKATCRGTYWSPTEKMSDVNMALNILKDFSPDRSRITCVVSADLDFLPPLKMIRGIEPKCDIRLFIPTFDDEFFWSRNTDFSFVRMKKLEREWLEKSQFPAKVTLPTAVEVIRPDSWQKIAQNPN